MNDTSDFKRQFPIKFKKNEKTEILEFANMQSNFNDTIRYLIEKEIAENGIRNLQEHIPPVRDNQYFKSLRSCSQKPVESEQQEQQSKIPSCYE